MGFEVYHGRPHFANPVTYVNYIDSMEVHGGWEYTYLLKIYDVIQQVDSIPIRMLYKSINILIATVNSQPILKRENVFRLVGCIKIIYVIIMTLLYCFRHLLHTYTFSCYLLIYNTILIVAF